MANRTVNQDEHVERWQEEQQSQEVLDATRADDSFLYRLWKKVTQKNTQTPENPPYQEMPVEAAPEPAAQEGPAPEPVDQEPPAVETAADENSEETQEESSGPVVDAKAEITVSGNKMSAFLELHPPENGGSDITEEQIRILLSQRGITTGIMDDVILVMVQDGIYSQKCLVAAGTPPVNGKDGEVAECFQRVQEFKPLAREDGSVDFKNLNLICNITQGTTICKLTAPTPAVDGKDVFGQAVRGYAGKMPEIPKGKNTVVSEDGLRLEAACSGHIRFADGKFHVEDVLRLSGNVNNEIGNIDFSGDVIVEGDVYEGFSVTSGKNGTVWGTIAGAAVSAKGNIVLKKGINGMNKGTLIAQGDVRGQFFENCSVKAGGSVYADSIINSTIQAKDKVVASGRHGVIIGGSCYALNNIEARTVGSLSNIATSVCLGAAAETLTMRKNLELEVEALERQIDSATKDIAYLEKNAAKAPLPEDRKNMLNERKMRLAIDKMKLGQTKRKLDLANAEIEKVNTCRLSCKQICPATKITIGNASIVIKEAALNQFYYFADGEIKSGAN